MSPKNHTEVHEQQNGNTRSPSGLNTSGMQKPPDRRTALNNDQTAADKTPSSLNPQRTLSASVGEETGAVRAGPISFDNMDLYGADFTFLNEVDLSHDDMLDFLPDDEIPGPSIWQTFDQGVGVMPPTGQPPADFRPLSTHGSTHSSPSGSDSQLSDHSFLVDDGQYSKARKNLDNFERTHKLTHFQLPSKYAMGRFVKAFFEHMAPHLPIIHRATFDIASVPSKSEWIRRTHVVPRGF